MLRATPLLALLLSLTACGSDPAPAPDTRDAPDSEDVPDSEDTEDGAEVPDSGDAGDAGDSSDAGDGDTASGDGDVGPQPEGFLNVLASAEDLARLGVDGGEVKYLARVDGRTAPAPLTAACYFQDMHRWEWHIEFLHSFAELADLPYNAYTSLVLARPTRSLFGGAVRAYPAAIHPRTGKPGVLAFTVYAEARAGSLVAPDLIELDARLEGCIPFAKDLVVWVPADVTQRQLAVTQALALEDGDVDVVMPEGLRPGLTAEAYVTGEGYGTLLVVPEGQVLLDYGPRDVVITTSAPNDISLVAGLVTRDPQNVHSHVNLRLAEKQIPSASVAAIYDNALVAAYDGKLVHLVVTAAGVALTPATLEDAEAFWESRRPTLPEPRSDLTVTALDDFLALGAQDALAYGVKAANLGELHELLPAEHRVEGFGIPFSHYADFVATTPLASKIEAMLADVRMRSDRVYARAQLDLLRESFEDTPFPPALLEALTVRLRAVFGESVDTTRVRFRSSTNAEDLDVISGAGLYDSKSGCLADDLDGDTAGPSRCLHDDERAFLEGELAARQAELVAHPERVWLAAMIDDLEGDLTREKPVARAVRKVWASLWNDRAFEERQWYGIDHTKVFMGLAVEPSFVLEKANAVAVTNLPTSVSGADGLYRLVSQVGGLSVVRPEDPLAVAEVLTFVRAGDPPTMSGAQVLVPSSLLAPGETVWTQAELATLSELLFLVQDHFAAEVYPRIVPLALDLEIKRTHDDRIVIKQVRPYLGVGASGP